jgi:hypothetical protein
MTKTKIDKQEEIKKLLVRQIEENGINIDEFVKSASNITAPLTDDDVAGRKEYLQFCSHCGFKEGEVVYYKGIKVFPITKGKFRYFLGENSYDFKALKMVLKEDEKVQRMCNYVLSKYNMKTQPALHKYCYICNATSAEEQGFRLRKDLEPFKNDFDEWTRRASTMSWSYDPETYSYNCYIPLIKRNKSNNELINKYLELTFKDDLESIMDYVSLYAFENRYEISRPTLLLSGDRGTGKNTFLESLVGQIYYGVSQEITFGDNFTEWMDAKLAYIGEITEGTHRTDVLWDWSKRISGQGVNKVNTKNKSKVEMSNGIYFVMLTNEIKPFHIKDPIVDDSQNQMLVVKMIKNSETTKQVEKMILEINKLGYYGFMDFMKDHLGHWIYTDLFEHYKKLKLRIKNRPYRYGMPVPITKGLKEIIQLSVTGSDYAIIKCIEDLFYQNDDPYQLDQEERTIFRMFTTGTAEGIRGFLPLSVINKMSHRNNFDINTMIKLLRRPERNWIVKDNARLNPIGGSKANEKSRYGLILNIAKISKYFEEQKANSDNEIKIIQGKNEFDGNFTSPKYFGAETNEPEADIARRDMDRERKEVEDLLGLD